MVFIASLITELCLICLAYGYYPASTSGLDYVIGTTTYGLDFCSVYGRDGLWAVQFHPEKSGRPGLQMLVNFYTYCREAAHAH